VVLQQKCLNVHSDIYIYEEWLTELDHVMMKGKWKILLLVDNATSHQVTKVMSNVSVKFFPSNLTSELQPLDQGGCTRCESTLS
jgi:hypothetical protein